MITPQWGGKGTPVKPSSKGHQPGNPPVGEWKVTRLGGHREKGSAEEKEDERKWKGKKITLTNALILQNSLLF